MTQELPQSFEWRGTRWSRGVSSSYFPAKDESHIGLQLRNDCHVWFDKGNGRWYAALVPSKDCEKRSGGGATPGDSPQQALDAEVVVWLMTVLKLPGAREILDGIVGHAYLLEPNPK